MANGHINIALTPAAAVATDGTMTFTYPSGNASQFKQSGERLVISGLQNSLAQAADTFTLVYGGSSVVVTYKDATSIPAGTLVTLQLPLSAYADIVVLTDSTTGTASKTCNDTTTSVKDDLASIIATVNECVAMVNRLLALSRDRDNAPE